MKRSRARFRLGVGAVFLILGGVVAWWGLGADKGADRKLVVGAGGLGGLRMEPDEASLEIASSVENYEPLADMLQARLRRPNVRADEVVLSFKDAEARRRFLARAAQAGVTPLATIEALQTVRLRVTDYTAFARELATHATDYATVGANVVLAAPTPPKDLSRTMAGAVPVGGDLMAAIGLRGDNSQLGKGVMVAVLDGGVAPDPVLGERLRYLDIGYGLAGGGEGGAHALAVAALAAGGAPDARGVAPGATVLSVRVTGADGAGDTFSVARGVVAAIEAGAQVINISLGGYATSSVLGAAVDQALAAGVAVVAASGNDQATRLSWPAAYPGVVSVGAVDAAGQQAIFSNAGEGLQLTAPGYAIWTAGPGGTRVAFSGTSASAPVAAGAIAALMSQTPGLGAIQAADLLANYANDGGAAGADPDYGRGSVNLGWALDRANTARRDVAISALNPHLSESYVDVVVQNRGAVPVAGLALTVELGATSELYSMPKLAAGASATVRVPAAGGTLRAAARLELPPAMRDDELANNARSGVIQAQAEQPFAK
ncbi:MAG: S8 family serine peptidase [Verrucomicrobia bacterium]|nr:S8 family serine peptidase [Verrucomicrobiota bacterium]